MKIDQYPGLKKTALEIAYDNGIANRLYPEEAFLQKASLTLEGFPLGDIGPWDRWLSGLSDRDINIVSCGSPHEMRVLLASAPPATIGTYDLNYLLDTFFKR